MGIEARPATVIAMIAMVIVSFVLTGFAWLQMPVPGAPNELGDWAKLGALGLIAAGLIQWNKELVKQMMAYLQANTQATQDLNNTLKDLVNDTRGANNRMETLTHEVRRLMDVSPPTRDPVRDRASHRPLPDTP